MTKFKGETDTSTILGDFNTFFSVIDKPNKQKLGKAIKDLNDTVSRLEQVSVLNTTQELPIHVLYKSMWTIHQDLENNTRL